MSHTTPSGEACKLYTTQGLWYVVFVKDGELIELLVRHDSRRSVRTILRDDHQTDIGDAMVEFLRV